MEIRPHTKGNDVERLIQRKYVTIDEITIYKSKYVLNKQRKTM